MKKLLLLAMCLYIAGCYTPLNNSGIATNKSWLEIPAKKTDFDGKQYDACYQFNLHFIPAQAEAQLDLHDTCIDACCWRSEKQEIVLDFNKDFDKNLAFYGRAEKFTPAKITLKITHSNLLNTSAVHITPHGAIKANGTVKLKSKLVEDPVRLAQWEEEKRRAQVQQNARLTDQQNMQAIAASKTDVQAQQRARELVQRTQGTLIDKYFYLLDRDYRQKGYIFLVSQRLYTAQLLPDTTYQVTCHAQVQSGTQPQQLQNRSLSCGTWKVDLTTNTVSPQDSMARKIKAQGN